jgi:hypothetical protein
MSFVVSCFGIRLYLGLFLEVFLQVFSLIWVTREHLKVFLLH